jgi:hypothetical protein
MTSAGRRWRSHERIENHGQATITACAVHRRKDKPMLKRTLTVRRAMLALAACVLPLAVLTLPQSVGAWNGGGCNTESVDGLSVGACANVSNGVSINADGYVHGTPPPGCYVTISVLDEDGNSINTSEAQDCTSGHHVGVSVNGILGTYYGEVCITDTLDGGLNYSCVVSPPLHNP